MTITEPPQTTRFYCLLGLAILLRLILMPFTLHTDLIFVHYFPYFLSYQGVGDIYGYFGDQYLQRGFTYYPPLVFYLVAFFQWIIKFLNPGFPLLMEHVHHIMHTGSGNAVNYLRPFGSMQLFQWVFSMKAIFAVAEVLCVIFLWRIPPSRPEKEKALWLWLFHPVVLYATYIHGQYRMLSAVFILAFLYLVARNQRNRAFFVFGLLCLLETFPVLLLVPSILILGESARERLRYLVICLAPIVVFLVPLAVVSKGYVLHAYYSPVISRMTLQSITLHYPLIVGTICKVILLVFICLVIAVVYRKRGGFDLLVNVSLALLLVVYATTSILAHYFMWILPFFVLHYLKVSRCERSVLWILVALLFLFTLDKAELNMGLLAPLGPEYFTNLPSLHAFMDRFIPWGKVVAMCRLLFSLLCIGYAGKIYVNIRSQISEVR